jgi:hypothetical protein
MMEEGDNLWTYGDVALEIATIFPPSNLQSMYRDLTEDHLKAICNKYITQNDPNFKVSSCKKA